VTIAGQTIAGQTIAGHRSTQGQEFR